MTKEHAPRQITQATGWKSKTPTGFTDLELPSGNVCLSQRIKPEAFLDSGMIPDPIMPIIQKAINNKKGLPPKELAKLQEDPDKLIAAIQMFDRILVYCVKEPDVRLSPVCDVGGCRERPTNKVHLDQKAEGFHSYISSEEREPNVLYADDVDLEDKMFIFQWALGGAADLESFRHQLESGVVSVPTG